MKYRTLYVLLLLATVSAVLVSCALFSTNATQTSESADNEDDTPSAQETVCPTPILCPTQEVCNPPFVLQELAGNGSAVMEYDPSIWQYVASYGMARYPKIVHREMSFCEIKAFGEVGLPMSEPINTPINGIDWLIWSFESDAGDTTDWMVLDGDDMEGSVKFLYPTYDEFFYEICYRDGMAVISSVHPNFDGD